MIIKRFQLGPILENGYVIHQPGRSDCLIIDPGYEPERYTDYICFHQLTPISIFLTHLHHDHVDGAEALAEVFRVPILMHGEDAAYSKVPVSKVIGGGDRVTVSDETGVVLHTPGHTKGGVCLYFEKSRVCFTGDTLFDTDLGRTDLKGGSRRDMIQSVREVLDKLPNDISIYPGHEGSSRMDLVRRYNAEFRRCLRVEGE